MHAVCRCFSEIKSEMIENKSDKRKSIIINNNHNNNNNQETLCGTSFGGARDSGIGRGNIYRPAFGAAIRQHKTRLIDSRINLMVDIKWPDVNMYVIIARRMCFCARIDHFSNICHINISRWLHVCVCVKSVTLIWWSNENAKCASLYSLAIRATK